MAEVGAGARAAGVLLLGIAAAALGGCFERHEPGNPFIGPYGASEEGSFGALPASAPGQVLALAGRAVVDPASAGAAPADAPPQP